jgi:hypothetical protein
MHNETVNKQPAGVTVSVMKCFGLKNWLAMQKKWLNGLIEFLFR